MRTVSRLGLFYFFMGRHVRCGTTAQLPWNVELYDVPMPEKYDDGLFLLFLKDLLPAA